MLEVISPTITIKVTGFLKNGLISYILNKKKDTYNYNLGQNNTIQHAKINLLNLNNKSKTKQYNKIKLGSKIFEHNPKKYFHTNCRAINRIGTHNLDVISVIFGLVLGDGHLSNRSGEGVRICIRLDEVVSIIHKEYLFSLYDFFS